MVAILKTLFIILIFAAVIVCFSLGISVCGSNGPYGFGNYYIEEKGKTVAVDSNGNVIVSGYFSGPVDFDPGSGVDEHLSEATSATFISAFDSCGTFLWANTWHNDPYYSNYDENISVDANDCVYIAGSFKGTVDFDPGPNVTEYTASFDGVYLSNFDSEGNFKWTRAWGWENACDLAVDGSGNVYIIGNFSSTATIDFNPGDGVDEHTGSGVFLSKFDSEGNFVWAKNCTGNQIAIDDGCDIYVSGIFNNSIDFDPSPGEVVYSGFDTPFLCKLDSDANFLWVRILMETVKGWDTHIAIDPNSNLLVSGTFSNRDTLNPGRPSGFPVSNGMADAFLYKYDSNGDLLWDRSWGGSGSDFCNGVLTDGDGNIYVTGSFTRTVDFDPGSALDVHRSRGPGIYLSKFDPSGNFTWARTWGGSGWDKGNGIAFDHNGNIYVTGEFCGRIDFDPGSGTDWHDSTGYNDIFLSKFDLNGNFIWARTWGGENPLLGD